MKIEIRTGSSSRHYTSRSGAAYISVGSRPDSDIVLEDPAVSPLHLKIEHFVGRWSFTDQMSDSGTKLNGESAYSGELAQGDKLTLGGSTLTIVSLEDETEAASSQSFPQDRSWQDHIAHSEPPLSANYDRRPEPDYSSRAQSGYGGQATPAPVRSTYPQPGTFPPSGSQGPRQPAKAIAAAVALILVAVVGSAVAFLASGSDAPSESPRPDRRVGESVPAREGQPAGQPRGSGGSETQPRTDTRMPDEVEDEIKRQLDALVSEADTRAADDKLADYAKLKARAGEYGQHGLSWPLERVQTILRNQLFDEIQQRYAKDNLDIYHLKEDKKFGEALDRLYSLDRYLKQSDLHKELAKVSDMTSYVERELELLPEANFWYIGECFARADEALQRDDYEGAIQALKEARDNARLEQQLRTDVTSEVAGLGNLVIRQRNGDLPAARAAFDKRKAKLPAAPVSTLLPKGDGSAYPAMNALKRRLEEAWENGQLDQAECGFYGRKARLQPKGEDWRMELEVTREFGATISYTYRARYTQHQLPPGSMISLYEALNPTRDELLAMLLICFNEGLLDDAPRIACKLWKADETVKADLDQLLATKLKIEIPEGGFKEKDGRLVAE